ncbi:MAG TPA: hypothetical protein VML75_24565 [Kofleriaceae bacterium]|nr:hypothetical protein [Kofleriaceae bacterium]
MRAPLAMLGLVTAVACGAPPGETPPDPFEWDVALSDLDDAVLAVCEGDGRLLAVGGTAGRAAVYEWAGNAWSLAPLPAGSQLLWWCWVDDDGTAWAVGERATVLVSDGPGSWRAEDVSAAVPPELTLFGVWGSGPSDVHLVGGGFQATGNAGVSAHFDGAGWTRTDSGPAQVLFKVWGSGADDMWAVGTGGTILHYDGTSWTPAISPVDDRLIAVWGTGASEVYAVGGDGSGVVLRYDGTSWAAFAAAPERLSGVWTAPGEPLYVAGDRGFVARFELDAGGRPLATDPAIAVPLPSVDFHSVTSAAGIIVASGADLAGGNALDWRGAVATHKGSRAGAVIWPPASDAAIVDAASADAAEPADAGSYDAAPLPGAGEPCAGGLTPCAPGLECWLLQISQAYVCTESCTTATQCTEPGYGSGPCCTMPGFQTLETVCIDGSYAECQR